MYESVRVSGARMRGGVSSEDSRSGPRAAAAWPLQITPALFETNG